jgi:hypothetical protein
VSFRALLPSTNSINTPLKKRAKSLVGILFKELPMSLDKSLQLSKELLDGI